MKGIKKQNLIHNILATGMKRYNVTVQQGAPQPNGVTNVQKAVTIQPESLSKKGRVCTRESRKYKERIIQVSLWKARKVPHNNLHIVLITIVATFLIIIFCASVI